MHPHPPHHVHSEWWDGISPFAFGIPAFVLSTALHDNRYVGYGALQPEIEKLRRERQFMYGEDQPVLHKSQPQQKKTKRIVINEFREHYRKFFA